MQMQDDDNEESDDASDSEGQTQQQDKGGSKHSSGDEHEGEDGRKDSGYTFSMTETTILEVVMDAMRTCGLALALQALSTVMLGRTASAPLPDADLAHHVACVCSWFNPSHMSCVRPMPGTFI